MNAFDFKKEITIEDSEISFENVLKETNLPDYVMKTIRNSNILLLPYEGNECTERLFPEGTIEFLDYLQTANEDSVNADILADDDTFYILQQHSTVIEIAKIVVESGVLPIALSLISNYIYDLLKKTHRGDANVKVDITSDDENGRTRFKYNGPVSEMKTSMKQFQKVVRSQKQNEHKNK